MHIAFPARATFAEQKLLILAGEISEKVGLRIVDRGLVVRQATRLPYNFFVINRIFEVGDCIV